MRKSISGLILTLLFILGSLTSGCFQGDVDDSTIPWNRPADWEDQIPGMGR